MAARPATEQSLSATGNVRRKLAWHQATVIDTIAETSSARTMVFDIEDWTGHIAGQHVDVRLTAEDGYQATRSYSLSSGPAEAPQITVERVVDGEVSPYLVDAIEPGDEIELRGPIGGYFVWQPTDGRPLLIGGGSGIAPLRAMWRGSNSTIGATLLYSARTEERLLFVDELRSSSGLEATIHLTRDSGPAYRSGRIGADELKAAVDARPPAVVFVCGPTAFVESIAAHLVDLRVDPRTIRTERFG